MPLNNKQPNNKDIIDRVSRLVSQSQKLTANTSATANKYSVPENIDDADLEKEVEQLLEQLDGVNDLESDNEDIYGLIDTVSTPTESERVTTRQLLESADKKSEQLQNILLNTIPDHYTSHNNVDPDETEDDIIRRMKDMVELDSKYDQFVKHKDRDLEERYLKLKKDAPNLSNNTNVFESDDSKPKGTVPSVITKDELMRNEMENWCCICNEDAVIECENCDEEDNKYCRDCYYHTHQSEDADYEATKHKYKAYRKT